MDFNYYLNIFGAAANQLDKKLLHKKQMEVATGIYTDSVFLKLYKIAWANKSADPLTSESRIFFSVWISDAAIQENKILYNIHALKLRKLKGYSITSREFATTFRERFKSSASKWPNVSIQYGPLTLMQGWVSMDPASLQTEVLKLAEQFLETDHLVDNLLDEYKQPHTKNKKLK